MPTDVRRQTDSCDIRFGGGGTGVPSQYRRPKRVDTQRSYLDVPGSQLFRVICHAAPPSVRIPRHAPVLDSRLPVLCPRASVTSYSRRSYVVYSFRCVDRCLHMESTIGLRVGCVNNAAGRSLQCDGGERLRVSSESADQLHDRRTAQRSRARRRRSAETSEQTEARRAVERSRSERSTS